MKAKWEIDKDTLERWRNLVIKCRNEELPRQRREKNVQRDGINLSREEVWRVLVGCQVTTQQRSGPGSAVSKFMRSDSPALKLRQCRASSDVNTLLLEELTHAGLRRAPTMAKNLAGIFRCLEDGEWSVLIQQLRTLEKRTSQIKERNVVSYILGSSKYPGLGQKQARNFIQWLGLSRYEIPLDSRVLKKLREFGASFVPKGSALSDETVYIFIQTGLQEIASGLEIYPCELDACIFASFDIRSDEEITGNEVVI